MTFADELRAAATELRKQADGGFHLALANWLDHTASLIDGNSGAIEGIQSSGNGAPDRACHQRRCVVTDNGLKTLTIRNPWAFEIILGRKDIENRDWKPRIETPFRLNIHAGKAFDDRANYYSRLTREQCASRMGALIGIVTVVAIHDGYACHNGCSEWAMTARWHWELSNTHAIDPIPMKGRLGLWEVPEDTWGAS